jgi:hypothetical protein
MVFSKISDAAISGARKYKGPIDAPSLSLIVLEDKNLSDGGAISRVTKDMFRY